MIISCTLSQYLHQQQPIGTNYDTLHSSRQETVGSNGDVQGQYSYLDPTGSKVVVKYSAGKDGFRVLNDNAIQAAPAISVPQHEEYQYNYYQPQEETTQQYIQSPAQPQIQDYHQNIPRTQYYHEYRNQPQAQPQPHFQEYAQQSYQHQELTEAPAYQNEQAYQPKFTQAVFTPADNPYPAESEGQIKSYYEALEEEKKEAAKQGYERKSGATAHVSVQSPNIGYSYNLNL